MSSAPRTLWVSNDFPPRAGGIEHFLSRLVASRPPGSARVLASAWPGDRDHDAAFPQPVERVGRRPLLPTRRLAERVRRAAAAHRADVVVFGAAWPLGELGSALDVPTLAISHGHEAGLARVGGGRLVRRVARAVDAISVISEYTRAALEPWAAGHADVVDLAPGVDVDAFSPAADGGVVRTRHGVAADAPLVVCVSRLVARKGQDVLVEAWPDVRARCPGARLLLVGDGPLRRRLARRVAALGLDGAVTLVGEVAWRDLPAYHAAADVFAMPCRTRFGGLDVEGLGIVFLEAQATATPVVVGRSGGAPETVRDGETGVVVDGRSPRMVADALVTLLADPARRAAMGAAGRAFVTATWAWPVVTARLDAILAGLAARR